MSQTTFVNAVTLTDAGWFNDVDALTYSEPASAALTASAGSTATTFTFNGSGGTTGSVTLVWKKIGHFVSLMIPTAIVATGTGSTTLTSNTAIAAGARPGATQSFAISPMANNAAQIGPSGYLAIGTDGILTIQRDAAATAFSNSAVAGLNGPTTVVYYVA